MKIRKSNTTDHPALVELWFRSVQATHTFLSERDIEDLYPEVRDTYLPSVDVWVAEGGDGEIVGFIGLHSAQVEMLFVDPTKFGLGAGTALLDHARKLAANLTVDVNEQNPRAHNFYRHYGFEETGRSVTDSAGRPFPLIHMALSGSGGAR
ncbi:acetyltransferase [Dyella sp. 20L07]|uniref:acetyltransferase n=1 Tax=Dyella sp. 20L07 TaxID=3384240 RepID=UPI003D2DCA24